MKILARMEFLHRQRARGANTVLFVPDQQKLMLEAIDIELDALSQRIAEINSKASEAMRKAGASPRAE